MTPATTTPPPDAMLMRSQPTDTATEVSRTNLTRAAKYKVDDGPLTRKQLAAIRKAAGSLGQGRVKSSLF